MTLPNTKKFGVLSLFDDSDPDSAPDTDNAYGLVFSDSDPPHASPTRAFWSAWHADKHAVQKQGFWVTKQRGVWTVRRKPTTPEPQAHPRHPPRVDTSLYPVATTAEKARVIERYSKRRARRFLAWHLRRQKAKRAQSVVDSREQHDDSTRQWYELFSEFLSYLR